VKTTMTGSRLRIIAFAVALLLTMPACSTLKRSSKPGDSYPEATVLSKDTRTWDGNLLPAYPEGQPEVTILRISIPPGVALKVHEHPVINAVVLTNGDLDVVKTDGKTLNLKAGDSFIELVNTWHYGVNPGTVPAELIVFYAGVAGAPITVYQPPTENARPAPGD
jgi:quercetin dioxygenase-like cupin family protein